LTVAVVASVEVDVGMAEDAEEGSETEVLPRWRGGGGFRVGMSMDHERWRRLVGSCFAE